MEQSTAESEDTKSSTIHKHTKVMVIQSQKHTVHTGQNWCQRAFRPSTKFRVDRCHATWAGGGHVLTKHRTVSQSFIFIFVFYLSDRIENGFLLRNQDQLRELCQAQSFDDEVAIIGGFVNGNPNVQKCVISARSAFWGKF